MSYDAGGLHSVTLGVSLWSNQHDSIPTRQWCFSQRFNQGIATDN